LAVDAVDCLKSNPMCCTSVQRAPVIDLIGPWVGTRPSLNVVVKWHIGASARNRTYTFWLSSQQPSAVSSVFGPQTVCTDCGT